MKRYLQSVFGIMLCILPLSQASTNAPLEQVRDTLQQEFDRLLTHPENYEAMALRECRAFPEGNIYPFLIPALAYANQAVAEEISREHATKQMQKLIDLAIPYAAERVGAPDNDLLKLEAYGHHGTTLAILNLSLSRYALVCNDNRFTKLNDHISRLLMEALDERNGAAIDSYPAYTWYIDTIMALVSLKQWDQPDERDHIDQLYEKHLTWRNDTIVLKSGLPRAFAVSPSRGCDLSMQICLLAAVDPLLAKNLYTRYVEHHWLDLGYAFGFSEWPRGYPYPAGGDVDSGPVLFGIGGTASGLGIGAALAVGDHEKAERLATELVMASMLIRTTLMLAPENEYLAMLKQYTTLSPAYYSGFLYGDCSLFYALTRNPAVSATPAAGPEKVVMEYIGERKLSTGDKVLRIPWWRFDADYNTIGTSEIDGDIPVPVGTKTTYTGWYNTMEWSEWHDDDWHDLMRSKGLSFIGSDKQYIPPGPGTVKIRRWLYEDESDHQRMSFQDGRYYVFCLDREPVAQWTNYAGEASCDMDTELEHLAGIIAIHPTFEFEPDISSPLPLTRERLYVYQHERYNLLTNAYEPEWSIQCSWGNGFIGHTPSGDATMDKTTVQQLLYALNTLDWVECRQAHAFDGPAVTRTLISYFDVHGTVQRAVVEYDSGGWFLKLPSGKYYSTYYPDLLFEVEKNVVAACSVTPLQATGNR